MSNVYPRVVAVILTRQRTLRELSKEPYTGALLNQARNHDLSRDLNLVVTACARSEIAVESRAGDTEQQNIEAGLGGGSDVSLCEGHPKGLQENNLGRKRLAGRSVLTVQAGGNNAHEGSWVSRKSREGRQVLKKLSQYLGGWSKRAKKSLQTSRLGKKIGELSPLFWVSRYACIQNSGGKKRGLSRVHEGISEGRVKKAQGTWGVPLL